MDRCHGVWRVGSLAVSRGIGDRHLKQWVTAEPETKILPMESDLEFLILASDGLWDKVLHILSMFRGSTDKQTGRTNSNYRD